MDGRQVKFISYMLSLGNVKCWRPKTHFNYCFFLFGTDESVKEYLSFFRTNFPSESITPKLHIVEDHIIPWFQLWGAGLGLMGEQGGEGMHSHLNNIRSNLRRFSLTDELQLHLRSVEEQ